MGQPSTFPPEKLPFMANIGMGKRRESLLKWKEQYS